MSGRVISASAATVIASMQMLGLPAAMSQWWREIDAADFEALACVEPILLRLRQHRYSDLVGSSTAIPEHPAVGPGCPLIHFFANIERIQKT
jgi:hypothetical protein